MAIVTVRGVPDWVDPEKLLDPGPWENQDGVWIGERHVPEAALIAERLRNLGMGGRPIEVVVQPRPRRNVVRKARLEAARLRRRGDSGFRNQRARVDDEGRAYLTSERLAMALARRTRAATVVDATCGCGGNAIAFARLGSQVTAIDIHAERLDLAQHNARVYGVDDRITFLLGDARDVLPTLEADLCFVDPPWGDVDRIWCRELPLFADLLAATRHFRRVWAKVPPSFHPAPPGFLPEAWFGVGEGDRNRVKFVLLRRDGLE